MSQWSLEKLLFFTCLGSAVLCQVAGTLAAGLWGWAAAAVFQPGLWLLARRFAPQELGSISLIGMAGLAVAGLALGCSGWLMISSAGLGLAAWDLLQLEAALKDNPDDAGGRAYRDDHLKACALAVGSGLALALVGRLINLQIPFVVMLGLAALAVWGFGRAWRYFIK